MKKLVLPAIVVAFAMTSCSTVEKTSTSIDVLNSLTSKTTAELVVSQSRISYNYHPSKRIRRGGPQNCKSAAVSEALRNNGNADVLVAPEFTTRISHGLFFSKIKEIIVTGYPATYKQFVTAK